MYYLYKYDATETFINSNEDFHYEIKNVRPRIFKLSLPNEKISFRDRLLRAYFHIITHGKFRIYYVVSDENEIIHTSFVLGKCYKFPFMSENDYEIGPCVTKKEYRGKGIYPNVIKRVISENKQNTTSFYMFCDSKNFSSAKGILKAGFKEDGFVEKKSFKIYARK